VPSFIAKIGEGIRSIINMIRGIEASTGSTVTAKQIWGEVATGKVFDRPVQTPAQKANTQAVAHQTVLDPNAYSVHNISEWQDNVRAWMAENNYSEAEIQQQLANLEGQMKVLDWLGAKDVDVFPVGAEMNRDVMRGERAGLGGPIRSNEDRIYRFTFDASAMCVKRLGPRATARYVQGRIGRNLSTAEQVALTVMYREAGKDAACLYCYIESMRMTASGRAKNAADYVLGEGPPGGVWGKKTMAKGRAARAEVKRLGLTRDQIDPNYFTDPQYAKDHPEKAAQAPLVYEFITQQVNNAKANKPKLYEEYSGQALRLSDANVEMLNGFAGFRIFSSSDFQSEHVVDLIQLMSDLSLRRAKAHAYTKVSDFVNIFGKTGVKIQASIFAKEVNGQIVADVQGMPFEDAKRFRVENPDVGTCLVATSDNIVRWGLQQPWIDYIIPFHHSGLEIKYFKKMDWSNYTSVGRETFKATGENVPKEQAIRMHELGLEAGVPDSEATLRYLKLCEERGYNPVFSAFLKVDSGQTVAQIAAANPNFVKLKKDYARTDTPFNVVDANRINQDEVGKAIQRVLSKDTPGATVDKRLGNQLIARINRTPEGADLGVDALGRMMSASHSVAQIEDESEDWGKPADEILPSTTNPIQAINEALPSEGYTHREMWAEATKLLADPAAMALITRKSRSGEGLSGAEQKAQRRQGVELYAAGGGTSLMKRREAAVVFLDRKASGTRASEEFAGRKFDLSTPEGRREAILTHTLEMSDRWAREHKNATTKKGKDAVVDRWVAQQEKVNKTIMKEYGIDLLDPRIGEIFDSSYAVGRLLDAVSDAKGTDFHMGQLVSYYAVGNILTLGSVAVNATGYPLMLGLTTAKSMVSMSAKLLTGQMTNENLASIGGAVAAAKAGTQAIAEGIRNGAFAFWTGRAQASKVADPLASYDEADKGMSPIRNPLVRTLIGPALEVNRFVDEMFWTIGYRGALAAAAMERKHSGDSRSLEEIQNNPDADLVEKAARYANWFTLRGEPDSEVGRKAFGAIKALRNPTLGEGLFPAGQYYWINPIFFLSPFFHAIANLTIEGVKLSPYGALANTGFAAGRIGRAATTTDTETKHQATTAAVNNLGYVLAGMGLLGVAMLEGDDDEYLLKGSPPLDSTGAKGAFGRVLSPTRTFAGKDVSRFDPIALPAFMYADLRDGIRELVSGKKAVGAVARDLGEKAFSSAIQRQFLQSFADLFRKQYQIDPETGKSVEMGVTEKYLQNAGDMLVPGRGLASTYNKLTGTEREERGKTFGERAYGSGRPVVDAFGERAQRDTTGIESLFFTSRTATSPKVLGWMKFIEQTNQGAKGKTLGGKSVEPWYPDTPDAKIGTVRLTPEEHVRLKEVSGKLYLSLLDRNEPRLKQLPPERRLEMLKDLHEEALNRAKIPYRKRGGP